MAQDDRIPATETASREGAVVIAMAVALAVMVVWGGTPLFSKLAAAQIPPLLVGILRTVIAGALALPLALAMRIGLPKDREQRWLLGVSGAAAFVIFPLMFTVGQSMTSAVHGALILATLPVFTSLFGTLVERRSVSVPWIVGCAIALAGEALVIVWRAPGHTAGSSLVGDAIVLASALLCSIGYVAGARLGQRGYPPLGTTLWGAGFSALALLPLLAWQVWRDGVPVADPVAWGSVLVLAVLTSILGYVAWYWALARGGIARIASVQFTQPLFGLALAAIFLGERLGVVTAIAAVLILTGAFLVQRAAAAASAPDDPDPGIEQVA